MPWMMTIICMSEWVNVWLCECVLGAFSVWMYECACRMQAYKCVSVLLIACVWVCVWAVRMIECIQSVLAVFKCIAVLVCARVYEVVKMQVQIQNINWTFFLLVLHSWLTYNMCICKYLCVWLSVTVWVCVSIQKIH